jgi:predicted  nucleic acid-binding Zn-ribbon protein
MGDNMPKTYEPDSRFVERLEWQLASEYRRLGRTRPAGKIAIPRWAAMITVMVGVLMTGAAVIKAADYIKDSWRKKIELARVETEVALNRAHLESIRELAARTEELYSNRMVQEEEHMAVMLGVERAGLALERSILNLDEVKATGFPPRDDLYAPLANGRDFVSERLMVEAKEVEADLKLLASRRERIKELVEKAGAAEDELDGIQTDFDAHKTRIDEIRKRLDLRKRFVSGEITAQEVEIMDRLTIAKANLNQAQARVEFLKKQLERLQTMEAEGVIPPTETGQLRHALNAAQAELKLVSIEIKILEKAK